MIIWILILAFGLRLINLNQSLWLDEAIQAWASRDFSLRDLFSRFFPTDVHPPLSYLVNFFWNHLAGYSEMALRFPSVVFGVLTVYVVYRIGQLVFPRGKFSFFSLQFSWAELGALLLATSGLYLYYSQEARMYSLATLTATLAIWFLLRFLQTQKKLFLAANLCFNFLSLFSHYLTGLIFPAQLLLVVWLQPRLLKTFLISQLGLILLSLPWLTTFLHQFQAGVRAAGTNLRWASVVGGSSLKAWLLIPVKFLIGRLSIDNNFIFALIMFLPLCLVVYLFWLVLKNYRQKQAQFKLLFAWFFIPLVLALIISFKLPVLDYHRLLFLLPPFYLILVLGLSLSPLKLKPWLISFLLVLNLSTSAIYLFNPNFHREDWRHLSQVLISHNPSAYPVAIISAVRAPLLYYYSGPIVDYDHIGQAFTSDQIWLVPYAEALFDPTQSVQQTILEAGYHQGFKQHFRGDLTLIQYIK